MRERSDANPQEGYSNNLNAPESKQKGFKKLIRNRFGHIRAGWRMIIYLLMVALASVPVIAMLKLISEIFPSIVRGEGIMSPVNIIFMLGIDIALVLGAYLTLRWIDRRSFGLLGLGFSRDGLKEFLTGFLFGFIYLSVTLLIMWIAGSIDVKAGEISSSTLKSILMYLILFAVAGTLEELVNRGYPFQVLIEGTRLWIAVLSFSLIFSLVHSFNQGFSWIGGLCLLMQGILLSLVYFRTRSLWVPIGIHISWNWAQGPIWGMKVSGVEIANSLLVSVPRGSEIVSGGNFGAEGSLITLVLTIGLVWYIWKAKWIKPRETIEKMWRKYPSGFGIGPSET